jgi:2-keto-4-pentenoate hydratase/2-oxohepta-3-ene-1,7-dioic acid hydratase in catechol pathway
MAHPKNLTYATIVTANGPGLGIRTARGVLDVAGAARALKAGLPATVEDVIHGRGDTAALVKLAAGETAVPAGLYIPEDKVAFGPCVASAPKIICLGLNYEAHAAEGAAPPPTEPILFNKFDTSLNHHGGTINLTGEPTKRFDHEVEMVMIMGRGGRNIPEDKALDYVFGYATGNDFSARDLQRKSAQWMLGKCGDGWGPIGPWLVSADQIDPHVLDIKCYKNGDLRQSSNTRLMIFNCNQIIAYCSRHFMLEPGDVIFTGTCEGIIAARPDPDWIQPGDTVTTVIEKLGEQVITFT